MVWMHFLKLASHNQIIMAVHSPLVFTLGIDLMPGVKVIELREGYVNKVRKEFEVLKIMLDMM